MEFKKASKYDINIIHTSNGGTIVNVGCGTFSFSTPQEMLSAMHRYYNDPEAMEKKYGNIYTNQPIGYGPPNPPPSPIQRALEETGRDPGTCGLDCDCDNNEEEPMPEGSGNRWAHERTRRRLHEERRR